MKRQSLIKDLKSFYYNSIEMLNRNNSINRDEYFRLMKRVEELSESDFESKEKYQYFLNYINEKNKKADRNAFEAIFIKRDLNYGYNSILDYMSNMTDWLN